MLAKRWPYVVYPTPTINQRYNGLPTLVQGSHGIWDRPKSAAGLWVGAFF